MEGGGGGCWRYLTGLGMGLLGMGLLVGGGKERFYFEFGFCAVEGGFVEFGAGIGEGAFEGVEFDLLSQRGIRLVYIGDFTRAVVAIVQQVRAETSAGFVEMSKTTKSSNFIPLQKRRRFPSLTTHHQPRCRKRSLSVLPSSAPTRR